MNMYDAGAAVNSAEMSNSFLHPRHSSNRAKNA